MRWKKLLIIFAAIVIVVIVALIVIISSYDFNKLKPGIESVAFEATGRELKLGGDIEFKIGLTPALVVSDVTFQNAEWGSRPEALSIKRFEVKVALLPLIGGNISVKRFVLIEPDLLIETDSTGKSNLEFKPPEKPKEDSKPKPKDDEPLVEGERGFPAFAVGEILVRDGRLTYNDGKTGKATTVKLDRLRVVGSSAKSPVNIDIKGSFDDRPFGFSGRFDSIAKVTDPSLGPLNLSSLKVRIGKSEITGKVDVDISAKRPRVTAHLASSNLDLREFIKTKRAEEEKKKSAKKPAKKKKVFPNDPIAIESMKAVDLDLSLKVKKLFTPALAMSDLSVDMTLKNGHLLVVPLKASVGGGKLDAKVDIRPSEKAIALDVNVELDNLDLARMAKELKIKEALSGTIDADMKVKGSGASVAALMASLNGETKIVMGEGRIENKFLKFVGRDIASSLMGIINPLSKKEKVTVVNCMVTGFDIDDGLAKSSAMVVDTNYM
ncbi:MAG: AsmA family protein, partial [Thermodesulfobacteriota bacterium]